MSIDSFFISSPKAYQRPVARLVEEITYRLLCERCGGLIDTLSGECSRCRTVNEIKPEDSAIIQQRSRRGRR